MLRIYGSLFSILAIFIACYQLFTQTFELQGFLFLFIALSILVICIQRMLEKKYVYGVISLLLFLLAITVSIIEFLGL